MFCKQVRGRRVSLALAFSSPPQTLEFAMRRSRFLIAIFGNLALSTLGLASGPGDRVATDPKSVVSAIGPGSGPVDVKELLSEVRLGGVSWSLDGQRIAYISNASGRLNLWVMQADGSGARPLLSSNDRQADPLWTADGTQIVYTQDSGGDEMYDLFVVAAEGGTPKNLTQTALVSETSPRFSPDGAWLEFSSKAKASPWRDVAVMEWKTGSVRLLTHESDPKATWSFDAWSPDGRYLYATRTVEREDSDVFRIDRNSGTAEKLTSHMGKVLLEVSDVSPDGKTLLVTSNEKDGYSNVALMDLTTKTMRWVTDTQWEANSGQFSPKGDTFTYTLNADGRTTIEFVDVMTSKTSDHGVPAGLNSNPARPTAFRKDGSYLFAHQDSTHAANLYLLTADGQQKQITHVEGEAQANFVVPGSQLVVFRSFDGRMISAYMWVPFGLKREGTAPAVVMPHGGPTGQTVDSFNARAVLLVSRGYVVIAPNVRGSTGYGKEFEKANYKDLGGADLKDEIAGVEFLKATGYVDEKKVGIFGGSYGGFMTLMAIGKTPQVWAAAVDEYGILDWYSMLAHEDASLQAYEKSLLGDPVKDRSVYEDASPIKYIRNELSPLLVLQGERDIRVPKEEAEQLVDILKKQAKTVEAVYYPEEGHGFIKREDQLDELTRSVEWLDRYLKGDPKNRIADKSTTPN
jgi:dipeptidyl aminopeptidase/acylaminoacyl peptidase